MVDSIAAQWATAEEIAWADAHGIDLSEWVRAEHAAGIRIAADLIEHAQRRRLRAIDAAIGRRGYWLRSLHERGQRAADRTRQERREHRLSVERYHDMERPGLRWRPMCSCGWTGAPVMTRKAADAAAREEREHLFRPLSDTIEHTGAGTRRAGRAA